MTFASEDALSVPTLVDEVLDTAHGYVRSQEQSTSLATTMTDTGLEFTVADATQVSRGLVEIDDELVHVATVDLANGTATVSPWGRGRSGSTAVTHLAGARVTQSPLYPRQRVANVVYGVLREIFPDVFAVAQTLLTINPVRTNYEMPADCWHIMNVEHNPPGPTGTWIPAKRWRQNKTPTTVELELFSSTWPGVDRVRVRYMRIPPAQVTGVDDLATYGYDNQIRDLIVLGALAKLMAFTEPSRIQAQTVESHGRSEAVPAGSAQTLSRFLYQLFRQRLDDERNQQLIRWPLQPHQTR